MVTITFKNVGQGDSIILEWTKNGTPRFGVIDCNLYQGENPVVKHIKSREIKEIEFLLLSHPHFDHFSGFHDLLIYCQDEDVNIKRFLHSAEITSDFLKSATRSLEAESSLLKLFKLLKNFRNERGLAINSIEDNADLKIPLGEGYIMEVLSPSSIEKDKFIRGENYPFDEEDGKNNPNANWLSTILKISNKFGYILLTSDVESTALSRVGKAKSSRLGNGKILMAQIPHHGSKKNLNKTFWQRRTRDSKTPVVISVGENGYKHPSKEVVQFFSKNSTYELVCTNLPGVFSKKDNLTTEISILLDVFSYNRIAPSGDHSDGDKTFLFNDKHCRLI